MVAVVRRTWSYLGCPDGDGIVRKETILQHFRYIVDRSVACVVLPVFLFLVFDDTNGMKASWVFIGCISYAILEEVGWRGYLTKEFLL